MNPTDLSKFTDPDLFAAELHHWLNVEGLRSKWVLRLRRLARGDLELDRIFETKVAEFKRALRENRKPTIWNLPIRAMEWLADNAQFTPRRDVVVTLVYVVIVLVFFEGLRSRLSLDRLFGGSSKHSVSYRDIDDLGSTLLPRSSASNADAVSQIDEWFAAELKRAADSVGWKEQMMKQIAKGISAFPVEPLLEAKLKAVVSSESFQSQLRQEIAKSLEAVQPEFQKQLMDAHLAETLVKELEAAITKSELQERMASNLKEAVEGAKLPDQLAAELGQKVKSLDLRPAVQAALADSKGRLLNAIQEEIASDAFRKELAATVRATVESPEFTERLRTSLVEMANSTEFKNAFHENVRASLASGEFKKLIAASVEESLKPRAPPAASGSSTAKPDAAKPETDKPEAPTDPAGVKP